MLRKKYHRCVLYKKKISHSYVPVESNLDTYYFFSKNNALIEKNQIQASRVIVTREFRKSKISTRKQRIFWIYPTFLLPFTKKGNKSRMGKGKGAIDKYLNNVHKNDLIFLIKKINLSSAKKIAQKLSRKLSFSIDLVKKSSNGYQKIGI